MPSATQIIVNTDGGGDYPSLAACAEDLVGIDLQSLDTVLTITCRGGDDTAGYAYFRTMNSDATRYAILETDEAHQGDFTFPYTAGYRLSITTDAALLIGEPYMQVRNMRINQIATAGWPSGFYITADNVTAENILSVSTGVAAESYAVVINAAAANTVRMRNVHGISMATAWQVGLRCLGAGAAHAITLNNCGFFSQNYIGLEFSGAGYSLLAKNCMLHGSTTWGDITATFSAGSTHNAYFHDSAPVSGANWVDYTAYGQVAEVATPGANLTSLFTDPTGNYYPLAAIPAAGTDLSGDAFPVLTDIAGELRNGVYRLGAFDVPPTPSARLAHIGTSSSVHRRRAKRYFFINRR